ncbi:MAG: hypothetical protein DWQ06_07730 [Calditrichaeota bacterium]|nr:MAG: hypothetical protein DWQ06_07730 [Calditrichota bacterium]
MVSPNTSSCKLVDDDHLIAKGWKKRYIADPRMAREAKDNYETLGYEVHFEPFDSENVEEECQGCRMVLEKFVTVYTRK